MFSTGSRLLGTALALPALTALILAGGCIDRPGVTTYSVENISADRPRGPLTSAALAPGQAWFFKLLGKQAAVQAEAESFARLMATVRFDERGMPLWETPAGWTERKESGMRFATLVRDDSDPPLEIAVSALPSDDPGGDPYLKSNIDRWRGQVGLEPYAGSDWKQRATEAGEVRETDAAGGRVVLVQLNGQDPAGEAVTMLAAIVPRPAAAPSEAPSRAPMAARTAAPDGASPTYAAPGEWTAQPPRQFQTALWTVSQGDQKLEVSVSRSGGSQEMNLARWRGQVGLDPAADSPAAAISVGGAAASRVELSGAEQTIVGVIVPQGQMSWFFKMMGPPALVEQERARFDAFVDSVTFQ